MEQMEATFSDVPSYKEIELLYSLINRDPDFLHAVDKKHFVDTPLHFAAGEGRTQLALEIQRLMPSFGAKLNAAGLSPLHLALQRGHADTVRAMVRLNPELVGVQGREGITPLHYAAETDAVDMLAEFLLWSPESIEKLTVREETAAHVAVRHRKFAAFKVLMGWMKRKYKRRVILTWKDLDGNTVLHLAASTNQPQVNLLFLFLNHSSTLIFAVA